MCKYILVPYTYGAILKLDNSTKERLKLVLRQYELRERHFECFIRSKELELLLARYREAEQKSLVEFERSRIDKLEDDVSLLVS